MSGDTGSTNVEAVRAAYDAFGRGDFNPFVELLHPDVVWHLPGRSQHAGTTTTRDELFARMLRQYEQSGGTSSLEWIEGMEVGDVVVVLERLRASIGDERSLDVSAVVVYRFDGEGGKVVEAWDMFSDQAEYDGFWSTST